MNLPQQMPPIIRNLTQIQAASSTPDISASDLSRCYNLTGLAQQLCLQGG